MRDSLVKTAAPATPSADAPTEKAPDTQRRNFFPFSLLWFSIVALEISWLAPLIIRDTDIWVHLRNAQELLARHSFLHADLYTFTAAGAPLLNHEWLSELPYYLAFRAWGMQGLLAVYLVALWMIFGAVYYLALRRGANCSDAGLVTMAGVALGYFSFGSRMHQFGWLCMVGLLLVLERFQRTGKGLWLLPPLFTLWINLHGSWVFGFVVIGIYVVSGLVEGQWNNVVAERWTTPQLKKLVVVWAASAFALLANPYGYKLVWYPFDLLFRQSLNIDNMTDWKSVDFHSGFGKLAMGMLLALLGAAWFSRAPWKLRDILLAAFVVWASLTHIRFLIFAAIILVPMLGPRLRLFAPYDAKKDKPWLNLAMTALIAGVMLWMYPSSAELQNKIDTWFPHDALQFVQQKQITGRLFHYFPFGGYIEWYAPTLKTFIDPRTDIFVYNGVLDDYFKITKIERPLELLDKYKIDYVLFPVNKPLTDVLDHSEAWRTIYEDKVAKVYQRVPTAATTLKAQSN